MNYLAYLDEVIDRGIAAARESYATSDAGMLEGAIAGFESCRGLSPRRLAVHLQRANRAVGRSFAYMHANPTPLRLKRGWWLRCYQAEVDWVANCVSAVMQNQGYPPLASHHPTARAVLQAARIVGVHDDPAPAEGAVL